MGAWFSGFTLGLLVGLANGIFVLALKLGTYPGLLPTLAALLLCNTLAVAGWLSWLGLRSMLAPARDKSGQMPRRVQP